MASFDLSSLLGRTSWASMLLDVSRAIIISRPRLLTSCHLKPHCGRISVKTRKKTAAPSIKFFSLLLPGLYDLAISCKSSPEANRSRAFPLERLAHM